MRWFELAPHIGVNPDGSPQPFVEEGMRLMTQVKGPDGKWHHDQRVVKLLPAIAGSRITCTGDPAVAACLETSGRWHEIDMPRALRPRRPRQSQSPRRRR